MHIREAAVETNRRIDATVAALRPAQQPAPQLITRVTSSFTYVGYI